MSWLIAITIGVVAAVGVLQVLQRDTLRMVVGLYTFWNATNIFIIALARVRGNRAPLIGNGEGQMTDPLVQAMILTAIVITFGFTAFLVALNYWLATKGKSIDIRHFNEERE